MKRIALYLFFLVASPAFSATLNPIQLLNPAGSTTGQAIVSTGSGAAPAWSNVSATSLASQAANTVVANVTGSPASPTAFAMPSCSTSASALNWTSGTGFTCNTAINAATLGGNAIGTSGATVPLLNGSNTWSGAQTFSSTITPSQTAGIVGTTTNNNANAGSVGEFIPANASAVSLTTNVATNVTSISLTAGDWDVDGIIQIVPAGTTVVTFINAGISTTTGTLPSFPPGPFSLDTNTSRAGFQQNVMPIRQRISVASTTTVFLVASITFTTSTCTANGFIRARRIR
jgi:hypothetical protein